MPSLSYRYKHPQPLVLYIEQIFVVKLWSQELLQMDKFKVVAHATRTHYVQLNQKRSFVEKEEKNCGCFAAVSSRQSSTTAGICTPFVIDVQQHTSRGKPWQCDVSSLINVVVNVELVLS